MGLQMNINLPVGTNLNFKYTDFTLCTKDTEEILNNAYIKINNLNGDKTKINLQIGIYDKKDGKLIMCDTYEFTPDISSTAKNFLTQGYEQLKVNKYTSAVDLLDEGQVA